MPSRRLSPKGWWRLRATCRVARRQRCHRIASSSLLASRPQAPPAKGKELTRHYTGDAELARRHPRIISPERSVGARPDLLAAVRVEPGQDLADASCRERD